MRQDAIQHTDSCERQRAWPVVGGGIQLRARQHQQAGAGQDPETAKPIRSDLLDHALARHPVFACPGCPRAIAPPFETTKGPNPDRVALFNDRLRDVLLWRGIWIAVGAAVHVLLNARFVAHGDPDAESFRHEEIRRGAGRPYHQAWRPRRDLIDADTVGQRPQLTATVSFERKHRPYGCVRGVANRHKPAGGDIADVAIVRQPDPSGVVLTDRLVGLFRAVALYCLQAVAVRAQLAYAILAPRTHPNVRTRVDEHEVGNAGQMARSRLHELDQRLPKAVQPRRGAGPDCAFAIDEHLGNEPIPLTGVRHRLDVAIVQTSQSMLTRADPQAAVGRLRHGAGQVAQGDTRRRIDRRRRRSGAQVPDTSRGRGQDSTIAGRCQPPHVLKRHTVVVVVVELDHLVPVRYP